MAEAFLVSMRPSVVVPQAGLSSGRMIGWRLWRPFGLFGGLAPLGMMPTVLDSARVDL